MQMMALVAGGTLDQHLPDTTPTHADHWNNDHDVRAVAGDLIRPGTVRSKHRQAIADPGTMRTTAVSHDQLIEAVDAPERRFYVGVQWHPERTEGDHIIEALVEAARSGASA